MGHGIRDHSIQSIRKTHPITYLTLKQAMIHISQGSILGSEFAPWSLFWVSRWPMVAEADIRAPAWSVLSAWFTGGGTCNVCTNHNLTSHLQPHVLLSLIRSHQGTSGSWQQKSVCYWFRISFKWVDTEMEILRRTCFLFYEKLIPCLVKSSIKVQDVLKVIL